MSFSLSCRRAALNRALLQDVRCNEARAVRSLGPHERLALLRTKFSSSSPFSTQASTAAGRNYLDLWVKRNNGQTTNDDKSTFSNNRAPSLPRAAAPFQASSNKTLQITGSSYLIPTLRLERRDTPESIAEQLSTALDDKTGGAARTTMLRSMLQGKQINGSSLKWKVPIVLDVSSFSPDGSPHFSQVISNQPNLLEEFVSILNGFGINVMGVVGVSGGGMETEAVQLGLPSIMARSSASHRGRTPEGGSMDIHDVIDMVITKQMQDPTSNAPITANAPEMNVKSEIEEEIELVHKDIKIELVEEEKETEQDIELVEKKSESSSLDLPDAPTLPSPPRFATVYHGNVRSGQLVASERNQSVIIIGSVNSGGEVLSDGDVFIFGRLKGRAMAGLGAGGAQSKIEPIDGDDEGNSHSKKEITLSARIFASHFDPELICIGDAFTTVDNVTDFGLNKAGEAAMVSLDEEGQLAFERIPL